MVFFVLFLIFFLFSITVFVFNLIFYVIFLVINKEKAQPKVFFSGEDSF